VQFVLRYTKDVSTFKHRKFNQLLEIKAHNP